MEPTPPLLIHQALAGAFALGMVSCSEDSSEALGTLEWDRINGRAVTSEPIVEVLVKEGQQVKQGAPLIKLDTRLQEARIAQLQAQVVKAEWSLKQLETGYRQEEIATAKAELAGAVQNLKTMQVEYERKVRLGDPGAVSEQAIERAENNLAQAKAKELTARENLHLLSGFMFPFQAMPEVARDVAEVLPMTHFMRIVRGIILRDASLAGLAHDLMFLAGFFVVTLTVAILRFRKRLD